MKLIACDRTTRPRMRVNVFFGGSTSIDARIINSRSGALMKRYHALEAACRNRRAFSAVFKVWRHKKRANARGQRRVSSPAKIRRCCIMLSNRRARGCAEGNQNAERMAASNGWPGISAKSAMPLFGELIIIEKYHGVG